MTHPAPNFLHGRRYFLYGAAALATVPALWSLAAPSPVKYEPAKNRKPLPDIPFSDAEDKLVRFADLKGKVLLVNFWATWCAPCVKEMPSLDRLQARFGKERFRVLPLSLDGPTRPRVAPFYENQKLANLGIWFDKGRKLMQALDVSILPTSIVVDTSGRELGRIEGEVDWDIPEAIAIVTSALAG